MRMGNQIAVGYIALLKRVIITTKCYALSKRVKRQFI